MALRVTKALEAVAETVRLGDPEAGLAALDGVAAPEPFKAMIRGEIAAFRLDWDTTVTDNLTVVEAAWTDQAWHTGNAFHDHLQLLTYAALRSDRRQEVLALLARLEGRGGHHDRRLEVASARVRDAFASVVPLSARGHSELPTPIVGGASISSLYPLLAENRPRVPPESAEGVSYLLHFAPARVSTSEVLALYETVADQLEFPQEHEPIALLYLAVGDEVGAWRAVLRYARAWVPFEHSQVEPVQLFGSFALAELVSEEHGRAILCRRLGTPKAPPPEWPPGEVPRSTASHDRHDVLTKTVVDLSYGLVEVVDVESDDRPEVISGAWSSWTPTQVQLVVGRPGATEIVIARGRTGNGVLIFDGTLEVPSGAITLTSMLDGIDERLPVTEASAIRLRVYVEPASDERLNQVEILIDDAAHSAEGTYGAFIPQNDETFTPHMSRTKAEVAAGQDIHSSLDHP